MSSRKNIYFQKKSKGFNSPTVVWGRRGLRMLHMHQVGKKFVKLPGDIIKDGANVIRGCYNYISL
jgi:hypothetical protein